MPAVTPGLREGTSDPKCYALGLRSLSRPDASDPQLPSPRRASAARRVQEGQDRGREDRRLEDVVVRGARDDRERVAAGRPALAHPAAVALAATEQLED